MLAIISRSFEFHSHLYQKENLPENSHEIFLERNFIKDLLLINWDHSVPDNETNVNKLFSSFYNKLNKIVNKHAPIKSNLRRKVK